MSAAPGAERFPDEMELLDGSELCLHELEIETSTRELRTLADDYILRNLAGNVEPDDLEKARGELTTASQQLVLHLYDTGILISRQEDSDTTKSMVHELAVRLHDAFGIDNVRPIRRMETMPKAMDQQGYTAPPRSAPAALHTTEHPVRSETISKSVERMAEHAAEQLEQDLLASLGLEILALHPGIAERIVHDEFMETLVSLKKLGRISLLVGPLAYGADKLRALSKLADHLVTKVAA